MRNYYGFNKELFIIKREKNVTEVIEWTGLVEEAAIEIAKAVGKEILKNVFKKYFGQEVNYPKIYLKALEDLVVAIGEALEQKFIDEWVSDCESVRSGLIIHENDLETIKVTLEPQASDLVRRFMNLESYKGINSFMIAANLHLYSLK
ncbi:hypothetical protein [Lysinibacillus sp. NPDC047702]|uniref:hypothetical protein n=1 Tax=unclassified Lysinibacillus TaxID=2636778 RepID=UPI003D005FF8